MGYSLFTLFFTPFFHLNSNPHFKMKIIQLFDSLIIKAKEAKEYFERGAENDAFNRLDEIVKTIEVLNDFKVKCAALVSIFFIIRTIINHYLVI
jgi:hypothetical protein